jgi:hypothetical protein
MAMATKATYLPHANRFTTWFPDFLRKEHRRKDGHFRNHHDRPYRHIPLSRGSHWSAVRVSAIARKPVIDF